MTTLILLQTAVAAVPTPGALLARAWAWMYLHWAVCLAVIVWLVANVAPRPHPDQLTGWRKLFWKGVDLLCVLTAAKLPGAFKLPGVASPAPAVKSVFDGVTVPTDVKVSDSEDKQGQ